MQSCGMHHRSNAPVCPRGVPERLQLGRQELDSRRRNEIARLGHIEETEDVLKQDPWHRPAVILGPSQEPYDMLHEACVYLSPRGSNQSGVC